MADESMKVKSGDRSRLKGRVEGVQPLQKQIPSSPSRDCLVVQAVIASPSLRVILSVAKNLMTLRTGSAKQSHYCL